MSFMNFTFFSQGVDYLREQVIPFPKDYSCNFKTKGQTNRRKIKEHKYSASNQGKEFVLELTNENFQEYCMTGCGSGMMTGDFILIVKDAGISVRYRIEKIEYYLDPPDIWIALIKKCSTI